MKKIDTSFVTGSEGQPFLGRSLAFLQESYQEAINAIVNNEIGYTPSTNVFRIYGLQNSGSGATYIISAGAVYYNGEVYLVDATTFSTVGPQVAIIQVVQTFDAVDPILFESGASNSVHQVRKIQVLAGTSGSGIADYSAIKNIKKTYSQQKTASPALTPGTTGVLSYTDALTFDQITHKLISTNFSVSFAITTSNGGASNYATIGMRATINGVPTSSIDTIVHKDFFLTNYSYVVSLSLTTNTVINPGDVVKIQYGTAAAFTPIATVNTVMAAMIGDVSY